MVTFAIDIVVRGTALLILVFGLVAVLGRASASTRHLAWSFGMIGLLALPVLSVVLPWRLEVVPSGLAPLFASRDGDARLDDIRGEEQAPLEIAANAGVLPSGGLSNASTSSGDVATGEIPTAEMSPATSMDRASEAVVRSSVVTLRPDLVEGWNSALPAGLLLVWLGGVMLVLGRLLVGQLELTGMARRARPLDDPAWNGTVRELAARLGIRKPVRIVQSGDLAIPVTSGLIRPLVVLPASAQTWSADRSRAVLLHELAHVRRRDFAPHWLAWVACALYWFNPLVWIAARRLRSESERACDDLVLRFGPRASEYARHLVQLVRAAGHAPAPAAVLPLARRSDLEGRVTAILRTGVRRHGLKPRGMAPLGVAVLLFTVPVAAMSPRGISGSPNVPPSPSVKEPLPVIRQGHEEVLRIEDRAEHTRAVLDREKPEVMELEIGEVVLQAGADAAQVPEGEVQQEKREEQDRRDAIARAVTPIAAATRDQSPSVRLAAVTALGELEDPRAVAALSRALREDTEPKVREMAAWALGQIEDPAGVPALVEALRSDESVEVRSAAVVALGEIEDESAVPGLEAALRDDSVEIRRKSAWALGEIESPMAMEGLTGALRDPDLEVRRTVVWALGEIEDPAAVPALSRALGDGDVEIRRSAAFALGEIEDGAAVPALRGALDDTDAEVRRTAAYALAEIETPAAIEALLPLLESDDPEMRKMAIEAIAENQ